MRDKNTAATPELKESTRKSSEDERVADELTNILTEGLKEGAREHKTEMQKLHSED